ncbi:MAG TPA: xanthine dehydrogenase family protein subunit M [Blastocatellia bacterium]|nr:xanthine dehydrogenase family protein subunit M [Blastocatellia bacterium]
MRSFEYASPTTKDQAVALLEGAWGGVEVLAGGSDLLSLMKDDVAQPKRVVNLKAIKELEGISFSRGAGLRLGALVTLDQLTENAQVRQHYPVLQEAAGEAASPQIRNLATLGGNLCQRPRCWYFRAGYGLLAKGENGESLVPQGDNRYHAILGNEGPAYFVHPSTIAPVLIVLQAKVHTHGPKGPRQIPAAEFFRVPKSESERENVLQPNEIVTEITVPAPGSVKAAAYEVRHREVFDWPLATAAVALTLDGRTVRAARIVLGHVAPVPWPAPEAEQALVGKAITEETALAAAEAAVAKAKALSRNGYKIQLARVAVKRAILQAAG